MQEQLDRIEAKLDLLLAPSAEGRGKEAPSLQDPFPGKSPEEIEEMQLDIIREQLPPVESPPSVRSVMDTLESIRGYPSGKYAQEAKAVKQMLKQGYGPSDMFNCYAHLKEQHFWTEKTLTMTSVAGQIGEWKAHSGGMTSEEQAQAKHAAAYEQRWGPDSPWADADKARKAAREHERELREADEEQRAPH